MFSYVFNLETLSLDVFALYASACECNCLEVDIHMQL